MGLKGKINAKTNKMFFSRNCENNIHFDPSAKGYTQPLVILQICQARANGSRTILQANTLNFEMTFWK